MRLRAAGLAMLALAGLGVGPARPAPNPAFRFYLPDPGYPQRSQRPQAQAVPARIRLLLHPTPGAPALARSGGRVTLWVAEALAPGAKGVQVQIITQVAGHTLRRSLPVVRVTRGAGPRVSRVTCTVPVSTPRESYDVTLRLPDGRQETQPRALRVVHHLRGPKRVLVLADHQLWDPSGRVLPGARNAGAFPAHGERRRPRIIAQQGLHEVDLLDPDLVLHLGDLVFGLDFQREIPEALSLWHRYGPAAFFVPGNHDAYARFGLDLKASLPTLAVSMVRCRKHLPSSARLDWPRIWAFLTCVYGDLRPVLFRRLLADGLVTWRRNLGPTHYAFDLDRTRFIGLNTYDGTAERRHAVSLWVDIQGLHLGAPLVDNYGGTLSVAQVTWLRAQARDAAAHGLRLVVFGHHDPRGNPTGEAYQANQAFPTDPVGPDHFEAWNFDGAWDSNPRDGRGRETAQNHSGHALLRVLARYGGAYLSGHVHHDRLTKYAAGAALPGGIVARHPVTFVQVTTASSAPQPGGYWGYRLLGLRPDGTLDTTPFCTAPPLASVPAGNLWLSRPAADTAVLHTGLPRPVTVRVRMALPRHTTGYRFEAGRSTARLVDVVPVEGADAAQTLYYVRVRLPAADPRALTQPDAIVRRTLRATPLRANRPPRPQLRIDGRPVSNGATVRVRPGRGVRLEAGGQDPDGDALLPPWISDDRGRGGRASRVELTFTKRRPHRLRVRVTDEHGATGELRATLEVDPAATAPGQRPGARAAGCRSTAHVVLFTALALVLLGGILIGMGRRR